jgi:hypothetical protein
MRDRVRRLGGRTGATVRVVSQAGSVEVDGLGVYVRSAHIEEVVPEAGHLTMKLRGDSRGSSLDQEQSERVSGDAGQLRGLGWIRRQHILVWN